MKIIQINFLLAITLLSYSCNKTDAVDTTNSPTLLFSSGFEDNVYIEETPDPDLLDVDIIKGTDLETGFSWPIDVLGASEESGLHYISDDNKQAVFSEIQQVIGHNGEMTNTLYQEENYEYLGDTQCPYEILDILDGRKDLYVKYWMKIDATSNTQIDKWRALFEYKTKDYAEGTGFRLISYIYTDQQGNPYWHWQGDQDPQNSIWEIDNYDIPVPLNQWFLTEYFWHWSEEDDGRALWKINGQVVGDHFGPTTRNAKPIDFIILTQIYGDANPKHQWIDDLEIWDGLIE